MSSFKDIKKKEKIKVWENKIKRLYSNEDLSEEDLKYLNLQFDYYTLRKTYSSPISFVICIVLYNFFIIKDLHKYKRTVLSLFFGFLSFRIIRMKNRIHYETIISPYFEKYQVK